MNRTDTATVLDSATASATASAIAPATAPAWRGPDAPIFLVGMMGAGKTTLGRRLAQVLERRFVDLDHEIEARCGVRVATIFDIEGEAGFRRRESVVLEDCSHAADTVLATGGGAVLSEANRCLLRARGVVVYLHASVEKLHRRTRHDRSRPLLAGADPRGTLAAILAQREPLYREVADLVIDTGNLSLGALVQTLLQRLQGVEKSVERWPADSASDAAPDFSSDSAPELSPESSPDPTP